MMYELHNGYDGWGMGSMMGLFGGGLMMLLFWVLLVLFIVWIVRELSGRNSRSRRSDSDALEILKERYAKGEITKEQFESMKKDLRA